MRHWRKKYAKGIEVKPRSLFHSPINLKGRKSAFFYMEKCANENVSAYDLCPAKTAILMTDSR